MRRLASHRLAQLAWLLVALVFLVDLRLPETAAGGLLYVLVLLLGLWMPAPKDVLYLAGGATVLSAVEYVNSGAPAMHWTVHAVNHLLQITVVWITACGINLFRRTLIARERAERQAQASESRLRDQAALAQIGKMAAVVAHEVRNPLAGIRGAVQVIRDELRPEAPEREIAGEAIARIDTLNEIVSEILQFARPIQPVPMPTAFGSLVSPLIALLRDDPWTAGIAIAVEGEDVIVNADPQLLRLVLHNLLLNSAQAMNGQGLVEVRAATTDGECEIRIADAGPGIPPAVRSHLFEPFFTTKTRGTGLGLATVRRLVQAHGGLIDLVCPSAGGTTVILKLPREADAV